MTTLEEWDHPGEAVTPRTLYGRDRAEILEPDEETALCERMKAGDRAARERLIFSQLGLAVTIAHEYRGLLAAERGRGNPALDFQDVLQEAIAGLVRGVDRHDHTRGQHLSSITPIYMRAAVIEAFNRWRAIRYPRNLTRRVAQVARCRRELAERLGSTPSDEEIEAELGVVVQEGRCRGCGAELVQGRRGGLRRWCASKACQDQKRDYGSLPVREVLSLPKVADSLDRPIILYGDGAPTRLGDLMTDTVEESDDEDPQVVEDLYDAVAELPAGWRRLVIEHFGIDDHEPATVGQIAKRRGVSSEAVNTELVQALSCLHDSLAGREGFPDTPFPGRSITMNHGPQDLERKTGLSGDALLGAVRRLPAHLRRTLRAYYGLTGRPPMMTKQIAAREGVAPSTVGVWRWRAVQRLEALVSEDRESA